MNAAGAPDRRNPDAARGRPAGSGAGQWSRASSSSAARSATVVTATAARWAPPSPSASPALSDAEHHDADSRGPPGQGHAAAGRLCHGHGGAAAASPIDRASRGTAAPPYRAHRRRTRRWKARCSARASTTCNCAPATGRVHLLRKDGRPSPRGDVRGRLADLQRRDRRQPPHLAARHRQDATWRGSRRSGWRRCPGAARCRSRRWSSAESCTSPRPTNASPSMPAAAGGSGATGGRAPRASRAAMPIAASPSPAIACS